MRLSAVDAEGASSLLLLLHDCTLSLLKATHVSLYFICLSAGTRATVATWRFDVTELQFSTAAGWVSEGLDPSRNIVSAYHRGEFIDIARPAIGKDQLFINPAQGDTERIVFLLIANRTADVDEPPTLSPCNQSALTQLFTDVVTGAGALKVRFYFFHFS